MPPEGLSDADQGRDRAENCRTKREGAAEGISSGAAQAAAAAEHVGALVGLVCELVTAEGRLHHHRACEVSLPAHPVEEATAPALENAQVPSGESIARLQ